MERGTLSVNPGHETSTNTFRSRRLVPTEESKKKKITKNQNGEKISTGKNDGVPPPREASHRGTEGGKSAILGWALRKRTPEPLTVRGGGKRGV